MKPFTFNTVPSIVFGAGSISQLGAISRREIQMLENAPIMIITDRGLVENGIIARACASLEESGLTSVVFDAVVADPPVDTVVAAAAMIRESGAALVIGLGGGSSLDVAKLAALLAGSNERLDDIYGIGLVKGQRLPLILVPTTSGTGSEVTPISIVTTASSEKKGVVSPVLLPDVALLDPELTLGLPPHVTAATGIDAMVHAIEAFTSASANNNPLSQQLARQALGLLGGALLTAVHKGTDVKARGDMLLGAMLAGQAFANSPVAAVHALAYPIGGHFHIPHGLSNALVLPHVIRFNATVASASYCELATALFPHLEKEPFNTRADLFAQALAELSPACGLPTRLRDVGIPEDSLELLASDAMKQTRLLQNNPRPMTQADALAIYREAW